MGFEDDLAARVGAIDGMARLAPALHGLPGCHLVGGSVRDVLRGATAVDLDIAVEGDAMATASALAERLGGEVTTHGRFGTATLRAGGLRADLAATRRERYAAPGALPDVESAPLDEDLARRDFTVNAMAIPLGPDGAGALRDPHGGRADLEDGAIRVLHDRSFLDDPTRLLRALRYEARLSARMDADTEGLARAAIAAGAVGTVSADRLRADLVRLLHEPESPRALDRMHELGLDAALHARLRADGALAATAAAAAERLGADRALAQLAALVARARAELDGWVAGLGLDRDARNRVTRAAAAGPRLSEELRHDLSPAGIHALLAVEPPEALAVALALGAPAGPIERFAGELRGVELEITGADLVAAGVPESPALGAALAETLRRKLDGEVSGREAELELALSIARGSA